MNGRSTGVDLLSKLELESERNLLHYNSLAYTVCMKSALHAYILHTRAGFCLYVAFAILSVSDFMILFLFFFSFST